MLAGWWGESRMKRKCDPANARLGATWKTVKAALTAGKTGAEACERDSGEWDHEKWLDAFAEAKRTASYSQLHRLRVMTATHTVLACSTPAHSAAIKTAAAKSVHHQNPSKTLAAEAPQAGGAAEATSIEVWRGDCLAAGLILEDEGHSPAVLNMANQFGPGGGWWCGDGAQEENLFRRTAYFASLLPDPGEFHPRVAVFQREAPFKYPLGDFDTVYSPGVVVLKGAEADGYPTLASPRQMSFIACAAYRNPGCGPPPEFRIAAEVAEGMRRKIGSILATAVHHKHDAVVLSAFGCGAFSNPPNVVAALFKEVLESDLYKGAFKKVVFAIINDHNTGGATNPDGNIAPFEKVFGEAARDVPQVL
eukprot:TRINITY_DN19891_c0_g1_i1.p1 TRINITY_DN19891_c0_g1~~TRINITY_DN19891_c0_g1_i1.p1  ORF type:complete len:364 (+),score=121.82 TRINITY_DN19891_c0_g1_i1:132-1223(+)